VDVLLITGFRAIGCGIMLSSVAAIFINFGLSQKTRPVFLINSFFHYLLLKKLCYYFTKRRNYAITTQTIFIVKNITL
jgi:hypothetical protein